MKREQCLSCLVAVVIIGLILIIWGLYRQSKIIDLPAPSFCLTDNDCASYCGYAPNYGGRGVCVNKDFILGTPHDLNMATEACCFCEVIMECNTCSCENFQCVTHPTGEFRC